MSHTVTVDDTSIEVLPGTLLAEAATNAGVYIAQPCGGQGRCGRCVVKVLNGGVRPRSTVRLSPEDIKLGYVLACQAVVEGDASISVPEQDSLERLLKTDRLVPRIQVPKEYELQQHQSLKRTSLSLAPPSMDDQRDDWSRLETAVRSETNLAKLTTSLDLLRQIGGLLREGDWRATAVIDTGHLPSDTDRTGRLINLKPGHEPVDAPLWAVSIDIGTTTVTVWLVDLVSGQVVAQAAEYNRQIQRGEDVISRVIFAGKNNGQSELRDLVLKSINTLIHRVCTKAASQGQSAKESDNGTEPTAVYKPKARDIVKATVVGNSIMMHLLLGIPAESIRLSPFVTAVNHLRNLTADEVGLQIHPEATVDCLPCVASYVGADITAGVHASGLSDTSSTTLFLDVGTNGEIVLGCRDWLVTCACSAGPAFEGAGVRDGMRATQGAIEEVWIDSHTMEPTLRVIGESKPRGLCGSGLISLLAEMFLTGVVDKGGHLNAKLATNRIRQGESGPEYVVAWSEETWHEKDIVITHVDIDNLLRAKAAIYAGISVLAESVGVPLETVEQVLIGGSFGQFINVEKAIQIGLLPDMPWDRFQFLGNTAVLGAYQALLQQSARERIEQIAGRMTYIELSADNRFYEAFTSALFLPHTNLSLFPTVAKQLQQAEERPLT